MSLESTIENVDEYIKSINLLKLAELTVSALANLPDGTLPKELEQLLDVANGVLQNNAEPDHPG